MDSDDADIQANRLALTVGTRRYASDELRFTGIDMGGGRSRNKYAYQHSDDDDSSENDTQRTTESDTEDDARTEMENALVQSALARIRKAKAKGKQDVKLNKGELAALERRRKRQQAGAEAAAKKKGKDKRKKGKDERFAVPLSQLDSTPRPHSSASRHSPPQRQGSSSPFDYQYVSPRRHASDTGKPSSSNNLPRDEDWNAQSTDPFQYQTAGTSESYPTSALAYGELAPEDDTSNDTRVQLKSLEDVIVVEENPPGQEHGRSKGKKSSSRNSASSGGSRRRNDK